MSGGDGLPAAGDLVGGRFRIEERLGEGGMGVVYRATQLPIGREVALKVLRPGRELGARERARFEREARVAVALSHPTAVAVHDFGEDAGLLFLAMELLTGRSLRDELDAAGGPLPLARVLDLGWQIADVLAAAHRARLVHRDLKPDNVFLDTGDRVRVVDFGLAFIAGAEREGRMTREGVVTGTPDYLSPEQARGGDVGPPTDVYALGCVLYEMLTGAVLFAGSEVEVLTRQMFAPPPPLRERRAAEAATVPTALDALVMGMLDKRAGERPTAERVRDVLGGLDPTMADARQRGRDEAMLEGRAARMVEQALPPEPVASETAGRGPAAKADEAPLEVAIAGPADVDLMVGLSANGFAPFALDDGEPLGDARAIYAPGADAAACSALATHGVPVIADVDPTDLAAIAALVHAGASDAVARPVSADALARKLARAIRAAARRSGSR